MKRDEHYNSSGSCKPVSSGLLGRCHHTSIKKAKPATPLKEPKP